MLAAEVLWNTDDTYLQKPELLVHRCGYAISKRECCMQCEDGWAYEQQHDALG